MCQPHYIMMIARTRTLKLIHASLNHSTSAQCSRICSAIDAFPGQKGEGATWLCWEPKPALKTKACFLKAAPDVFYIDTYFFSRSLGESRKGQSGVWTSPLSNFFSSVASLLFTSTKGTLHSRVALSVIRSLGYRHKNQKVNNGDMEAASHRSLSSFRL